MLARLTLILPALLVAAGCVTSLSTASIDTTAASIKLPNKFAVTGAQTTPLPLPNDDTTTWYLPLLPHITGMHEVIHYFFAINRHLFASFD